jgi:hypothetical protein
MVQAVAFSNDGKKLATASADRTVKIWDAATGKDLATFKVENIVKVPEPKAKKDAPKKDEKKKDEAKKDVPKKDDAKKDAAKKDEKKKETFTKELGRQFTCVAFSPDDKKLCAGNLDGQIKIYDVDSSKEIGELKAHEGVWAIAFSSDGTRLATGGWDQTIKVWDLGTKKELVNIKAHNGTVTALAFSPDGRTVVSGSIDGTLKIWKAPAASTAAATGYQEPTKEQLATKVPSFFYFDYEAEPEPGKRLWLRIDDKHWIERYPSGVESKFVTLGRTTVDNIKGVVAEHADKSIQVFIPDKTTGRMEFKFRLPGDEGWATLAEMKKVE